MAPTLPGGLFLAAGLEPGISGVYLVRSPSKLGALTTRPSCCPKMWSMPAIVTTGRVFHHQPPSLWTLLAAGFEPGISGVYLVRSPPKLGALTTRPSCCRSTNLVYASHSNDGTCFSSPTAQPMDFFGSGIQTRHIRRVFSPFSCKAQSLNHSDILLPKKM